MKTRIKQDSKTKFGRIHLNMIATMIAYAFNTVNVAITNSIVAFAQLITRLSDTLTSIENLEKLAKSPITGFAAQRNALRAIVTEISLGMMGATRNFAADNNKDVLLQKMVITRSELDNMSLRDFMARVGNAIDEIMPLVDDLRDYGVSMDAMNTWVSDYDTLKVQNTSPTTAITGRKGINEQINEFTRQCMVLLYNQCDVMVLQLSAQYPEFVKGWFLNRKLRPNGHVITKLRAVVETELQEPIAGATVMVVNSDFTELTDVNGECTIDGIKFGNHQVVVISGSNSKTFGPYQFKKGQSRTIHFTMTPSFVAPDQTPGIVTTHEKVVK